MIASDLLPWLEIDPKIGFPWAVDRDTFESICMKISQFEQLRDFLVWRRNLHGYTRNVDESVFAGFFLKHGAVVFPPDADLIQFHDSYADVFEAEYFRRLGIPVEEDDEQIRPPVLSSMQRTGQDITFMINDIVHDRINIQTGKSTFTKIAVDTSRQGKSLRNSRCSCGSGKKNKKCCRR